MSKPSKTDDSGVAKVTLTPSGGAVKVSPRPRRSRRHCRASSSRLRGRRGERAAARPPGLADGLRHGDRHASKMQIKVSTNAAPAALLVGKPSQDKVTISNAGGGWSGTIQVRIYGPERTAAAIACTGTPVFRERSRRRGTALHDGGGDDQGARLVRVPGDRPGDASTIGLTTPCNSPSRAVPGRHEPGGRHHGELAERLPGTTITDTVKVTGLAGERRPSRPRSTAVRAARAIRCDGHAGLDGDGHRRRRRQVHDRAVTLRHARLLHLPRVDRRERHDRPGRRRRRAPTRRRRPLPRRAEGRRPR